LLKTLIIDFVQRKLNVTTFGEINTSAPKGSRGKSDNNKTSTTYPNKFANQAIEKQRNCAVDQ